MKTYGWLKNGKLNSEGNQFVYEKNVVCPVCGSILVDDDYDKATEEGFVFVCECGTDVLLQYEDAEEYVVKDDTVVRYDGDKLGVIFGSDISEAESFNSVNDYVVPISDYRKDVWEKYEFLLRKQFEILGRVSVSVL